MAQVAILVKMTEAGPAERAVDCNATADQGTPLWKISGVKIQRLVSAVQRAVVWFRRRLLAPDGTVFGKQDRREIEGQCKFLFGQHNISCGTW
jgi:hypothetical protein